MFHVSTQNLILVGVFAHLLLALSKAVFRNPRQQAQIDRLDSKVDGVLTTVQQVLPVVQTINRRTFSTVGGVLGVGEELSAALHPLPNSTNSLTPGGA